MSPQNTQKDQQTNSQPKYDENTTNNSTYCENVRTVRQAKSEKPGPIHDRDKSIISRLFPDSAEAKQIAEEDTKTPATKPVVKPIVRMIKRSRMRQNGSSEDKECGVTSRGEVELDVHKTCQCPHILDPFHQRCDISTMPDSTNDAMSCDTPLQSTATTNEQFTTLMPTVLHEKPVTSYDLVTYLLSFLPT